MSIPYEISVIHQSCLYPYPLNIRSQQLRLAKFEYKPSTTN